MHRPLAQAALHHLAVPAPNVLLATRARRRRAALARTGELPPGIARAAVAARAMGVGGVGHLSICYTRAARLRARVAEGFRVLARGARRRLMGVRSSRRGPEQALLRVEREVVRDSWLVRLEAVVAELVRAGGALHVLAAGILRKDGGATRAVACRRLKQLRRLRLRLLVRPPPLLGLCALRLRCGVRLACHTSGVVRLAALYCSPHDEISVARC